MEWIIHILLIKLQLLVWIWCVLYCLQFLCFLHISILYLPFLIFFFEDVFIVLSSFSSFFSISFSLVLFFNIFVISLVIFPLFFRIYSHFSFLVSYLSVVFLVNSEITSRVSCGADWISLEFLELWQFCLGGRILFTSSLIYCFSSGFTVLDDRWVSRNDVFCAKIVTFWAVWHVKSLNRLSVNTS